MQNHNKPIALIGMPGSGKTTIGNLIASQLNYKFKDLDLLIEKEQNLSIKEIFNQYGEESFRRFESNMLKKIYKDHDIILATGGGTVISTENLELLLKNFLVIYVRCDLVELYKRTKLDDTRPLLQNHSINDLQLVYKKRKNYYEKAHYIVDSTIGDEKIILDQVIELLRNYYEN